MSEATVTNHAEVTHAEEPQETAQSEPPKEATGTEDATAEPTRKRERKKKSGWDAPPPAGTPIPGK